MGLGVGGFWGGGGEGEWGVRKERCVKEEFMNEKELKKLVFILEREWCC